MCVCLDVSSRMHKRVCDKGSKWKAQNKLHVYERFCLNRKSYSGGFRRKKAWIINWRNYAKISSRFVAAASVVKRQTKINFNEVEGGKSGFALNPFRKISTTKILAPFLCAFTFSESEALFVSRIEQPWVRVQLTSIKQHKTSVSFGSNSNNVDWWTFLWERLKIPASHAHTMDGMRDECQKGHCTLKSCRLFIQNSYPRISSRWIPFSPGAFFLLPKNMI